MSALYSQGSNYASISSGTNSGVSGSTSNPQEHIHIPPTTAGVITPSAYNYNFVPVPIIFPPEAYILPGFVPIQPALFFPQMA